jgi:hypothetical protein
LPAWLPWAAFCALCLASAALVLYFTRGTTLWLDDWQWALYRRGGVHSLLASYNGHLSLVPILIYRALFATAGIGSYRPYRGLIAGADLLCGLMVFLYARRRVGAWLALLPAALILLLGPGWQNILWPFQAAWLISLACGIGALMLLERRERIADAAACLLLVISLGSSGIGVAVLAGAIFDVAWARRRWRDAWIVAVPAVLYGAWSIAYQDATLVAGNVFSLPRWVASAWAAVLGSLAGLSGQTPAANDAGTVLEFGIPLAVAGLALILWAAYRRPRLPARAMTWAVAAVVFWVLTDIRKSFLGQPYESRYEFVGCVFVLLFAVELAAGLRVRRGLAAGLVAATAAALLSNIGLLRDAGGYLRSQAPIARGDLAALDIARPIASPSYVASSFPGSPFVTVRAGAYFAMRDAIGSPAYSVSELTSAPEPARRVADAELVQLDRLTIAPARAGVRPAGPAPHLESASGGVATLRAACVAFQPSPVAATGGDELTVTVPASGLEIRAAGGGVVAVRRFGQELHQLGTITSERPVRLSLARDTAPQPWHVQLQTSGGALVCGE